MKKLNPINITSDFVNGKHLAACLFWVEGCDICKEAKESLIKLEPLVTKYKFYSYEVKNSRDPIVRKFEVLNLPTTVISDGDGNLLGWQVNKSKESEINEFLSGAIIHYSGKKNRVPSFFRKIYTFTRDVLKTIKNIILRKTAFTPMDEIIQRAIACSKCPNRVHDEKYGEKCSACGCKLSLKMWLKESDCVEGFWKDSII